MFNEHARHYGRAGAYPIVVPRATSPTQEKWVVAGAMGAIASGSYVLCSNRVGASSGSSRFGGRGLAFAPNGMLIAQTSGDRTMAVVHVDAAVARLHKSLYPCDLAEQIAG